MVSLNKLKLFIFLILCFNVAHAYNYSQKFEDENYFVDPANPPIDQVITNDQGVFLLVNDFWVCGQGFQASEAGTFLLVNGEWMSLVAAIESEDCIQASWICSKCGRYSMDGVNVCPYCGKRKNA